MSRFLLDEQPLVILKDMAVKIGLNESIILQQIHYWNQINEKAKNNYKDGFYWTFNSYEQWQQQFPFWSVKTIQRAICNLEKMKLVVSGNYNKLKIDRTKWYRIDYIVLEMLETFPIGQIDLTNMTEWVDHVDKMSKPLPKINTETNTKINDKSIKSSSNDDVLDIDAIKNREHIFNYFLDKYQQHYGIQHSYYKKELKDKCFNNLFSDDVLDSEFVECMIDDFFMNFSDINSYGDKREKDFALFCNTEVANIFKERNK